MFGIHSELGGFVQHHPRGLQPRALCLHLQKIPNFGNFGEMWKRFEGFGRGWERFEGILGAVCGDFWGNLSGKMGIFGGGWGIFGGIWEFGDDLGGI